MINLFIVGHNFQTRNARKCIKVSKDSDSGLVSIENLAKYFCLVVVPRSGTSSHKWPKTYLTWGRSGREKQLQAVDNKRITYIYQK